MATEAEFARVWQVLVTSYPNWVKDFSPTELAGTYRIYEQLLSHLPAEILETAAIQHLTTNKWFPALSELHQAALALMVTARRTSMEAWGEVVDAMKSGGARIMEDGNGYYPPEWSDPITAKVVACMGWRELCRSDNMEADRAHFRQAYDALVRREAEAAQELPMVRELKAKLAANNRPKQLEG